MTTPQEVLGKVLFALTERQKGNVIRSEDEYIDEARALLQSADSGEQEAPYSAPFTTDVAHCCGDPDTCNDPCGDQTSGGAVPVYQVTCDGNKSWIDVEELAWNPVPDAVKRIVYAMPTQKESK